jgi:hypothetical protein
MESLFETKEQYLEMRRTFKNWYNTEENKTNMQAKDFALYAAIRGKNWRKCFAPNSSEQTIETIYHYLTKTKLDYLYLTPYGSTITQDMITTLRERGFQKWGE